MLERWKTEGKWLFLKIVIEIHSSEIVLEKLSAGFELKITMKLEKVAHFKNNFLVNGSLKNRSLIFAGIFLTLTLHASISTDNNMKNANLINISI